MTKVKEIFTQLQSTNSKLEKQKIIKDNADNQQFTDTACIERKNSVSEIAGNFCEKDDRFLKELNRMINIPNCYILIENDSLQDVIDGNYKSKLNSLSLLRSLLTTQKRSGFYLYFVKSESMGQMIYEICKNVLDNSILK